jgi:hypothetical protein
MRKDHIGGSVIGFLFRAGLALMVTAIALFPLASMAVACEFDAKQNFKIFRQAEVILVATVASYVTEPENHRAVFEFDTIRVIIGVPGAARTMPRRWRAVWTNSTFGEPAAWKGPRAVIVGLSARIDRDGQPTIYVVQQSCSDPTLVPASEANLQAILKAANISPAPINLKDIPWQ